MRKKILSVLLAATMIATLAAGCSSGGSGGSEGGEGGKGGADAVLVQQTVFHAVSPLSVPRLAPAM